MARSRKSTPLMLFEMAFHSFETIAHRMSMIASGNCSPREYQKMMTEKITAMQQSALAAMLPPGDDGHGVIAPWYRSAKANAMRLRRKRR